MPSCGLIGLQASALGYAHSMTGEPLMALFRMTAAFGVLLAVAPDQTWTRPGASSA